MALSAWACILVYDCETLSLFTGTQESGYSLNYHGTNPMRIVALIAVLFVVGFVEFATTEAQACCEPGDCC